MLTEYKAYVSSQKSVFLNKSLPKSGLGPHPPWPPLFPTQPYTVPSRAIRGCFARCWIRANGTRQSQHSMAFCQLTEIKLNQVPLELMGMFTIICLSRSPLCSSHFSWGRGNPMEVSSFSPFIRCVSDYSFLENFVCSHVFHLYLIF